jgi:transposase
MGYIHRELRKKAVTLQLLWYEYRQANAGTGYEYSRFCELYRNWRKATEPSMRQVHKAGYSMMVDWAGMTIPIICKHTGEVTPAYIFVGCLPATNYLFAEAFPSMRIEHWITAHIHCLNFIGGVPSILIPDNAKTSVTKPCYYEPQLNLTYQEMADHYDTAIVPARTRKPRDKAKVETGVQIVERSILAPLRNMSFFSVHDLNSEIHSRLIAVNQKPFQKLEGSRLSLFLEIEKPLLKPLPAQPYEMAEWKTDLLVNIDYHVQYCGSFYSVPYQLVGRKVDTRATSLTVEIIHNGKRVASHVRSYRKGSFSTHPNHMPAAHRAYAQWAPSRLISWAQTIGPSTTHMIKTILESRPHPEQGYRTCLGIMHLAKQYPHDRLEAACTRAISCKAFTYRSVKSILKTGLDQVSFDKPVESSPLTHDNIRGASYFTN